MIRQLKFLVFLTALRTVAMAQTPGSAQANPPAPGTAASPMAAAGSQATVQAVLTKSIDAKKAKQGDKVEAKTTQDATVGGTAIPKGTKLLGHVTDAKAHTKEGGDSNLAITFDNAILKNGQTIPFHAAIVAAAAPAVSSPTPDASLDASGASSPMAGNTPSTGGPLGGVGNRAGSAVGAAGQTVSGVTRDTGNTVGSVAHSTVGTSANADSGATTQGSMKIPGVTLTAAATSQTNSSVFTSNSKNVKLESGSTLVLRVRAE